MSKNIGIRDKVTVLNLGSDISLKFMLNLGIACPIMHQSLFKQAEGMLDDLEESITSKVEDKMKSSAQTLSTRPTEELKNTNDLIDLQSENESLK